MNYRYYIAVALLVAGIGIAVAANWNRIAKFSAKTYIGAFK